MDLTESTVVNRALPPLFFQVFQLETKLKKGSTGPIFTIIINY